MKILLFDMDGVLLEPRGYHQALQETVALVGRLLGYRRVNLTPEDITAFEAAGVASEWDSAAICAALLLENLWTEYPALTLPPTWTWPAHPRHEVAPPNFRPFAHSLTQACLQGLSPLKRAERLLLDNANPRTNEQDRAVKSILRHARQIEGSLTHRIFQELVLGSPVFAETYGLPPSLDTESYLLKYDRPTLSVPGRAKLLQWLQEAHHQAVIFTSRPSRSPAGHLGTPEAEIGAHGAGLEMLPIVGLGGLSWLGAQRGCDSESFLKPSPVHTLAALRLALGDPLEGALEATAALVLDGQADHTWRALHRAQVYAFEDTVSGLKSVRVAKDILEKVGVTVGVHLFGITDRAPKRQALETAGAVVAPTLSVALDHVF
jgi:phosphoglycolate phosphatase-like HAD superfamily hydrolase